MFILVTKSKQSILQTVRPMGHGMVDIYIVLTFNNSFFNESTHESSSSSISPHTTKGLKAIQFERKK